MAWPSATMTWGERRLLNDGDIYHRDCSTPIDIERALGDCLYSVPLADGGTKRTRQDAPAGDGKLIMHSPRALGTLTASRLEGSFHSPRTLELGSIGPSAAGRYRFPARGLETASTIGPPASGVRRASAAVRAWEPMRARTALPASRASGFSAARAESPRVEEPWRHTVQSQFPRVTATLPGKQLLFEARGAARWKDRLSNPAANC